MDLGEQQMRICQFTSTTRKRVCLQALRSSACFSRRDDSLARASCLYSLCSRKIASLLFVLLVFGGIAAEGYAAEAPALQVGVVVLRPLHAAEIPAQQTGLLRAVAVAEGQRVEQGQLLATLDDREAKLMVVRAKIEHAQAEAKASNQVHSESTRGGACRVATIKRVDRGVCEKHFAVAARCRAVEG